jgi:hypothetical protein
MRRLLKPAIVCLLVLIAFPANISAQQKPDSSKIVQTQVTTSDAAVFNALLQAMRTTTEEQNGFLSSMSRLWFFVTRIGERPALINTTLSVTPSSDNKRKWDAEAQEQQRRFSEEKPLVPATCFRNAWERNSQPFLLTHYQPTENIKVFTPQAAQAFEEAHTNRLFSDNLEERYKEMKRDILILRFSFPGYDEHKQAAVVHFEYRDGSRHGGTSGVAFLSKVKGKWKAPWCVLFSIL